MIERLLTVNGGVCCTIAHCLSTDHASLGALSLVSATLLNSHAFHFCSYSLLSLDISNMCPAALMLYDFVAAVNTDSCVGSFEQLQGLVHDATVASGLVSSSSLRLLETARACFTLSLSSALCRCLPLCLLSSFDNQKSIIPLC